MWVECFSLKFIGKHFHLIVHFGLVCYAKLYRNRMWEDRLPIGDLSF